MQGYWDGNRFVIPGLPRRDPVVTPQGIIPQAAPVQSPVSDPSYADPFNSPGTRDDDPQQTPSTGSPGYTGGLNMGSTMGGVGGLAGMATGVPGLGLLGAGIGTGIDTYNANQTLGQFTGSVPHNQVSFLDALLNNISFGLLGESTVGQALNSVQNHPDVVAQAAKEAKVGIDAFGGRGDPEHGTGNENVGGPGQGGNYGGGGDDFDPSGRFAKGTAYVERHELGGPDPEGPDDGFAALDEGEAVIPARMVEMYGVDVMQALVDGEIDPERLRALL